MMTETIIGAKADIVCLCETKLMTPTSQLTHALRAHKVDHWVSKDVVGAAGGIMIGSDSASCILVDEWVGRFDCSLILHYLLALSHLFFNKILQFYVCYAFMSS